jgi:hypothetical protein
LSTSPGIEHGRNDWDSFDFYAKLPAITMLDYYIVLNSLHVLARDLDTPQSFMAGKSTTCLRVALGVIGLRANMKYILLVILLASSVQSVNAQDAKEHRRRFQIYYEDSTNVYWTSWPNPFSPPTVTRTTKGLICGYLTFFCDLTDSVQVAIVDGDTSDIVNEATATPDSGHDFSVCYWVAGPLFPRDQLPPDCFKRKDKYPLSVLLIVNGRQKCLTVGVGDLPQGWYCWIDKCHRRK